MYGRPRRTRLALVRPLVLIALIAGAAWAVILWRPSATVATAAPIHYAVEMPSERFPASALDTLEHGRGAIVPASALTGFAPPEGYDIPEDPDLLPNSEREYRGGYHEGIDFPLAFGMPVTAAKAGRIVRIDLDYVEWSVQDQIAGEDVGFTAGYTPEWVLDRLRGRQVWIDHGNGVVSRYAHLQSVELLSVGSIVAQGTLVGRAGNSGTKAGPHLHIEIRVRDGYLGDGLTGEPLLRALRRAFS